MHTVSLSENWCVVPAREVTHTDFHTPGCDCSGWLNAKVPGTVQAALVDAGRAPSPWRDTQAEWFRGLENETWLYRCEFAVCEEDMDSDRFELLLEGVSLFGTVWLNGHPIGYTDNGHRAWRFDATQHINREGVNVLVAECGLRLEEINKRIRSDIGATGDRARSYVRLCQMSFGWDFAPRLLPTGLWRPVSLLCHRGVSLSDVAVRTDRVEGDKADLTVSVTPHSFAPSEDVSTLHVSVHDVSTEPAVWESSQAITSDALVSLKAEIASPRLWYPLPMGDPALYTLVVEIRRDGVVMDRQEKRFGIRTVELKRKGQFTFSINGTDVFARGANWVPPHTLNLDTSPEQYRHLLELARDGGFNMLRVWGGGTYENDLFYELCDEMGIMVWQDFMYACGMYPDDDPTFMESVKRESEEAVLRLRSHPSIVLWCGENECQDTWAGGYEWYKMADRHYGARIYEHVLPDVVNRLAPDVPWWPGSPYGGPTTMSLEEGDYHDWYGLPDWRRYDTDAPRFSSEYGFRSVPQHETVDKMISRRFQWDSNGPLHNVWDFHHGNCGWMKSVMPEFGKPETLDDFIMLTQELQATLMRYAIESYRRKMFSTSGSLIWQYNEPWPAVTFSLVDFFGRPKAAYYWAARAHAPVMGMFYGNGKDISFWGISDTHFETRCTLRLRRYDHAGKVLGENESEAKLIANSSTCLLEELPPELHIESPADEFLHSELRCGLYVSERFHHEGYRRDWNLNRTELEVETEKIADDLITVYLSTDTYTHFVSVSVADPAARYSDNFIDLLPGRPVEIEIRTRHCTSVTVRAANAETQVVEVS